MSLIWEWHAVEETEHKAVCFDLYKAGKNSWFQRSFAFGIVTLNFLFIFSHLYLSMLWKDGCFKISNFPKTVLQIMRFFWGTKGVGWHLVFHGVKYLSPNFHPWNQDNKDLVENWLTLNKNYLKTHSASR